MKKIIFPIFLILISFLLSSCISVKSDITISKDFKITNKITEDITRTNEITRNRNKRLLEEAKTNTWITITETATWYIIKHHSEFGDYTTTNSKVENPCNKLGEDEQKGATVFNYETFTCKNLDTTNDKVLMTYSNWDISNESPLINLSSEAKSRISWISSCVFSTNSHLYPDWLNLSFIGEAIVPKYE